jgi:hypothetical protein
MTEQECKECQVAAVALKGISLLGLLVLLTVPSFLFFYNDCPSHSFKKIILVIFILTALLLAIRSWHLYFDSQLLKNLASKNLSLIDIDVIVLRLFRKTIKNKTINDRINSCYKLAKSFFVLLGLHLAGYLSMLIHFINHT